MLNYVHFIGYVMHKDCVNDSPLERVVRDKLRDGDASWIPTLTCFSLENHGQAERDLEALMQINAQRFFDLRSPSGLTVIGLGCAGLSSLGLLGFSYQIELAQAVFLLAFPISLIAIMSLQTAAAVRACDGVSERLYSRFRRHRIATQLLAVASIFVTATWGMYHNISHAILGGIN